ncbi:MAG: mechanosensitive ion channel [Pseudomonadota bacterium]
MESLEEVFRSIMAYLPNILGAMAVLIIGWLIALGIAALVGSLLRRTTIDNRIAQWVSGKEVPVMNVERVVSKTVYYILLLLVVIAFLEVLRLRLITEPISQLLNRVFGFLPELFGAILLLFLAWIVAKTLRIVVAKVLSTAKIDEKLGSSAGFEGERRISLAQTIADVVFWLVLLLFLPAVLGTIGLEGVLAPVQTLVNKVLAYLPNIFAAALILLGGWFAARIIQRIVTSILAPTGIDRLGESVGISPVLGKQHLSDIVGLIAYVFVLIPVIVAALNALNLESITAPASNMLNTILAAIPLAFTAALVLIVAYMIGRILAGVTSRFLAGVGFNALFARLGLESAARAEGSWAPSSIAGYLALIGVMLFATAEAARLLGFAIFANLVSQFTVFAGNVILGLIILGIGLYMATVASKAIRTSDTIHAGLLALAARVTIIVFAAAMALREMGLANEIISLAFGLLLGAVAVAVAIAFGVGGRQIAARQLNEWVDSLKAKHEQIITPGSTPPREKART